MVDLALIIACYNAGPLLRARVEEFETLLAAHPWTWELLLCDDGSQDDTAAIGKALAAESPRRIYLAQSVHHGRGFTVRAAIPHASGRWIGYVDVDASTSATYLIELIHKLQSGFDVAEAARKYHLTPKTFPFIVHRYVAHRVYRWLVEQILGLQGHDTETGFKLFQREALLKIRELSHSVGWFWDTEMIANAHRLGCRIAEVPSVFIRHPHMFSTLRLIPDSIRQFRELLLFRQRLQGEPLNCTCARA